MGQISGEAVACQIVYRLVAVAGYGLFDGLADLGRVTPGLIISKAASRAAWEASTSLSWPLRSTVMAASAI